eukprot:GHVH01007369.1.p1 GENE.GHVH01007369.1~~GHVH01007369.1.p1  ORF type:complete len:182 (-),score=25.90 GHVH01007369.1:145-690(-)
MKSRPSGLPLMDDMIILIQCHEWLLYRLDQLTREKKRMCYLFKFMDFGGLVENPMANRHSRTFMKTMSAYMSNDYCDCDKMFLAMNTPTIFNLIFAVMKVFLSARQRSKMQVMKADEKIELYMPSNQSSLPPTFGGVAGNSTDRMCYQPVDEAAVAKLLEARIPLRKQWIGRYAKKISDLK